MTPFSKLRKASDFFIVLAVLTIASNAWAKASFQALGTQEQAELGNSAYSISADGSVIAGNRPDASGKIQAFFSKNGNMTTLAFLSPTSWYCQATAVSADGSTIVGHCNLDAGNEAFLWRNGKMTGLGHLGSSPDNIESRATAVSSDGSVVVGYSYQEGQTRSGTEAFRWANGTMTGLGDFTNRPDRVYSQAMGISADGSIIVGTAFNGSSREAFLWKDGKMTGLGFLEDGSNGRESFANAVSADGKVIVGCAGTTKGSRAFRWKDGQTLSLPCPAGRDNPCETFATGVSGDGSVVVGYYQGSSHTRAFIWVIEGGTWDLQDFFAKSGVAGLAGWRALKPVGISSDGLTIVGNGTDPAGVTRGWIAKID